MVAIFCSIDVMPTVNPAGATNLIGFQQWGNWYRSALSRTHIDLGEWTGATALDPDTLAATELRNIQSTEFDQLFQDITFGHFQISAVNALRAFRAIPRSNPAAGVSSVQNTATI